MGDSVDELVNALEGLYGLIVWEYGYDVIFQYECSCDGVDFSIAVGKEFSETVYEVSPSISNALKELVCESIADIYPATKPRIPHLGVIVEYFKQPSKVFSVVIRFTKDNVDYSIAFEGEKLDTLVLDKVRLDTQEEEFKEFDLSKAKEEEIIEGMVELFGSDVADVFKTFVMKRGELLGCLAKTVGAIKDMWVVYELYP